MHPNHPALSRKLETQLWLGTPFGRRSEELTPIYIDRYNGPRYKQTLESHDFWELACVIDGDGILRGRQDAPLTRDTLALIPPTAEHTELSESGIDIIWTGFCASRLSRNWIKSPTLIHSAELTQRVQDMWAFAISREDGIGPELDAMLQLIVARFSRILSDDCPTCGKDFVEGAVVYLHTHFADPQPLAGLIQHTGYCSRYVRRVFLKRMGVPPQQYLMNIRIKHARRLLDDTELSIGDIATRIGFNDPFYFSRTFHRLCGMCPRTFRRRIRDDPFTAQQS